MSGHLPCAATLSMSRHISTLNYLRSADTCLTRTRTVILLVVHTCYNGKCEQMPRFLWSFQPKIARGTYPKFYVHPTMMKKRTILSFEQCASCRPLAVEVVRQNTNSTYRSKQNGHRIVAKWNSGGRPDMKYVERQNLNYVEYNLQVFAYCTIS